MEIQKFRELNNRELPEWYQGYLHILFNSFLFIALIIGCFFYLPSFSFNSLIKFSGFLFLWSVLEYLIHRFILHGTLFKRQHFQQQHSIFHHGYFTENDMNWKTGVDINRVLLMPIDLIAVLFVNFLIALLVYSFSGFENGLFLFFAGLIYILIYEVLHGLCHSDFAHRIPVIKYIVNHHTLHHNSRYMEQKNFSVTSPWLDIFFGSHKDV